MMELLLMETYHTHTHTHTHTHEKDVAASGNMAVRNFFQLLTVIDLVVNDTTGGTVVRSSTLSL